MNILLEEISKKFGNTLVLNNLNIEIEEGKLICLLGPSGCGKSTLLSIIAGLEDTTSGNIYFGNKNVNLIGAESRDIGMVFQNYALYPHMTVFNNIAFPLKMKKYKRCEYTEKVNKIAKTLQIKDLLKKKPNKLSGGQQQRVAIARALVKEPSILLLDEPLSNLDAKLRIELREEIKKIQALFGITTVFVTHDQEEALSISDKIILLNNGMIQQYATPKEMYLNPSNIFVAGFLGNPSINLINGLNIDGNYNIITENENLPLTCNEVHHSKNNKSSSMILGIRPEDITLCSSGSLRCIIKSIQPLGREIYITLSLNNIEIISCSNWDNKLKVGAPIYLSIKKLYVFE